MAQIEYYDGTIWTTVGNSGTVTSITAGTGLSGGTITSSGTIALASVGTSGTYAYPVSIITDAQGRVTTITAGTAPVTSISGTTNQITVTGTVAPTISLPNAVTFPGSIATTGAATVNGVLTANSTGYMVIPVGTTAQRPGTAAIGMFRLNTSL